MTEQLCITEPDGTISFAAVNFEEGIPYRDRRYDWLPEALWYVECDWPREYDGMIVEVEKEHLSPVWFDAGNRHTSGLAVQRVFPSSAKAARYFELLKTEAGRQREMEHWTRPEFRTDLWPEGDRWPDDYM